MGVDANGASADSLYQSVLSRHMGQDIRAGLEAIGEAFGPGGLSCISVAVVPRRLSLEPLGVAWGCTVSRLGTKACQTVNRSSAAVG